MRSRKVAIFSLNPAFSAPLSRKLKPGWSDGRVLTRVRVTAADSEKLKLGLSGSCRPCMTQYLTMARLEGLSQLAVALICLCSAMIPFNCWLCAEAGFRVELTQD